MMEYVGRFESYGQNDNVYNLLRLIDIEKETCVNNIIIINLKPENNLLLNCI